VINTFIVRIERDDNNDDRMVADDVRTAILRYAAAYAFEVVGVEVEEQPSA
jgi:hypothetical protein